VTAPNAAAVIVAAGRGERFGAAGKCLAPLAGRPLLAYALDAAEAASTVSEVVVVAGSHTQADISDLVAAGPWRKPVQIVLGGAERQHSVAHGVSATSDNCDVVVVHDAARPLVVAAAFDRCAVAAYEIGAAILAAPVADTIKKVRAGQIVATVPRHDLWAAQTPQAFRRAALLDALSSDTAKNQTFTDEAGLFEALGQPVGVVPNEEPNPKITRPGDLRLVEALLNMRSRLDIRDSLAASTA
jgi:2-C-methyl-D-erythritol 4-phosphate cytidylyltransferase